MRLAEVGEPNSPVGVEHKVVWPFERGAVAGVVEPLEASGHEVDALDSASRLRTVRALHRRRVHPAVVAHVERAVGTDRCAVGAAADLADDFLAAVPAPGDPAAGD